MVGTCRARGWSCPGTPGDRLDVLGDRLWVGSVQGWTSWSVQSGQWRRQATGAGLLIAQPPDRMGLVAPLPEEGMVRQTSPVERVEWTPLPQDALPGRPGDAAWVWRDGGAFDAWDQRWNESALPPERQRQSLFETYRPEWRTAMGLRASVKGWLPRGPEVALREPLGVAWVWVGDCILLCGWWRLIGCGFQEAAS